MSLGPRSVRAVDRHWCTPLAWLVQCSMATDFGAGRHLGSPWLWHQVALGRYVAVPCSAHPSQKWARVGTVTGVMRSNLRAHRPRSPQPSAWRSQSPSGAGSWYSTGLRLSLDRKPSTAAGLNCRHPAVEAVSRDRGRNRGGAGTFRDHAGGRGRARFGRSPQPGARRERSA